MKYYFPSKTKKILLCSLIVVFSLFLLNNCFSYIITDEEPPLSGAIEADVSFYLFDPIGYKAPFTNVAPSLCDYVGEGRVTFSQSIYNDPATVEDSIISEPDYHDILQTNSIIEWGSLFKYKGSIIVVGKYSYISDAPYIASDSEDSEESEEDLSAELSVSRSLKSMVPESEEVDNTPTLIELDKNAILNASKNDYPSNTELKWDGFSSIGYKNDVTDGVIPIDLLDDPVYCSMNLPSEAMSDFSEGVRRQNGHIINPLTPAHTTAVGIGAIYLESGKAMDDDFTICLGKMALYAFSKSQNQWVVVDEQNTCKGLHMYELPWTNHTSYVCKNVTKYDDHVEIRLSKDEINNHVFHFWGVRRPIDQSDYLYYATAYTAWVKEDYASGILTTEGGIDAKEEDGSNIKQLNTSRSLSLTTSPKTVWSHTIPNSEYNHERDGVQLMNLFYR